MNLPGSKENYALGGFLGGLTALAILVIGIFSGVGFFTLLLRAILFGLLLTILGFASGFLLEKLIHGIWDEPEEEVELQQDNVLETNQVEDSSGGSQIDYTVGEESPASLNLPDGSEDLDSSSGSTGATQLPSNTRVVGNIRIIDDKQFPDDPEDYAKAIRTMMNRDKD